MKEVIAISYALLNSKGVVVMFDIFKELLLKQFENKGKNLDICNINILMSLL